jgi:hypothetical protein
LAAPAPFFTRNQRTGRTHRSANLLCESANLRAQSDASSPLPTFTSVPAYFADPTGSFDYGFGADANTAIAYTVDPLTGYFVETANSPFTIAQIGGSLTFSIPPGGQGVSGPSAQLSATSLSFGSQQTATTSAAQVITLTSNGGEALSVTSIALSGADPTQFTERTPAKRPPFYNLQNSVPSALPLRRPTPARNKPTCLSQTTLRGVRRWCNSAAPAQRRRLPNPRSPSIRIR